MDVVVLDADIVAGDCSLGLTNHGLDLTDFLRVDIARFLMVDEVLDLGSEFLVTRSVETEERGDLVHHQEVAHHVFVTDGDVARGLVCYVYVVVLVDQTLEGTAHRDDVVIGVRREHDHALGIRLAALWTEGIVGVRLAAGPAGDGVLKVVEDLDVHVVCGTVDCKQFA